MVKQSCFNFTKGTQITVCLKKKVLIFQISLIKPHILKWVILPTEPRELAHEAPCLVTILIILGTENRLLENAILEAILLKLSLISILTVHYEVWTMPCLWSPLDPS